jgi:hypothetical protein
MFISTENFIFITMLFSLLRCHETDGDNMYVALVGSMLEYASVAWNSITITHSNKLVHMANEVFSPLSQHIFQEVHCHYVNQASPLERFAFDKYL